MGSSQLTGICSPSRNQTNFFNARRQQIHARKISGSFLDLRPSAVHPGEFILPRSWEYDQCSYSYVRYRDSLSLHWLPVYQITQDEVVPRLIPASLAVTGYSLQHPEERIVPILSTGFAAGTRLAQTILRGIYEIVERDAFMIAWLNRLSCPRLQVRSTSSLFFFGFGYMGVMSVLQAAGGGKRVFWKPAERLPQEIRFSINAPKPEASPRDSPAFVLFAGC